MALAKYKEYRQANKERINNNHRIWCKRHRDKIRKKNERYRLQQKALQLSRELV